MSSVKEIQGRIKSVKNIKKITRAMEMVAAVKMRKSIEAVLRTRTYSNLSWMTVLNIAGSVGASRHMHPFLEKRQKINREAIILICSNRGLCGNFNGAIIQKAVKSILKHGSNEDRLTEKNVSKNKREVDFIILGKKGFAVKTRFGLPVVAEFSKQDVVYEMKEVVPVAKLVIDDYLSAKYDKVMVAYTDFVSAVKQIPRVKQLLPIDLTEDEHLGVVGLDSRVGLDKDFIKSKEKKYLGVESSAPYVFTYEPDSETILNEILPRLIEVQLFQALLESNASENSVRMSAMKKASEAADDISSELTLHFNKARQASITREISELVAGVNALNN